MAEIVWSLRAIKDIDEIAGYIAKDSLQYAEAQVNLFFSVASILEKYPYRGRYSPGTGHIQHTSALMRSLQDYL
jgi:plasmid stabilization system protein ParE